MYDRGNEVSYEGLRPAKVVSFDYLASTLRDRLILILM